MSSAWKKIGSLRKSQKGSNYLKIDNDVTLKKGDVVQLQDPRKSLDAAVAAGRMDSEKAEGIKAKIPEYIKYDLVLAPATDKK
jgi:sulfite reductase beta subunit-like hemoprotein